MNDGRQPLHPDIEDIFPDFALGALDDVTSARVASHLDQCAACQDALDDVLLIGALLTPASPRPAVRADLLWRIPHGTTTSLADSLAPGPTPDPRPVTPLPTPIHHPRRWSPSRLGLVAAVLALVVGLAGWNLRLQRDLDRREPENIASIVGAGAVIHPLRDAEATTGSTGMLYSDPASETALLVASDLPPLPAGEEFQVWLFTADDQRERSGRFIVDAGGDAVVTFTAERPFADYVAIGVTAEPPGSEEPTSPIVVSGSLG